MIYSFSQDADRTPAVARNRSRKMREILGVALKLACEGGLDNLTLHRLADRMDRSVAAVYRYFPSKEAVVAELQRLIATHIALLTQDAQDRLAAHVDAEGLGADEHALAALLVSGFAYEAYAMSAPLEFGLVSHYLSSTRYDLPEQDAAHVFEVTSASLDGLATLFHDAERKGLLIEGEPRERAVIFWGAMQGTMDATRVVNRTGWDMPATLITNVLIGLLAGWGANRPLLEDLSTRITRANVTDITRNASDLLLED